MRAFMTAVATGMTALLAVACTNSATDSEVSRPDECVPVTSTDLATADGWLAMITQSPDSVGLYFDDGRGRVVEHRADEQQPLASAVKVVHLAAYARAVSGDELDPDEQIPLLDWERWYVPGTDGGAHPAALERLGVANDGVSATDPDATVRLDDMVTAMIQESDNAVPDYLRYRLGDDAIADAAAAGGWTDFEVPSLVTSILAVFEPSLGQGDRWETANKWAFDQQFRQRASAELALPSYDEQKMRVAEEFVGGSAAQLNSLYRAIADGGYGDAGDVVLRHLEWQPAPDGVVGLGFKGGSLPGVLTQAFEVRREDGTVGTAVWLIDDIPAESYDAALSGFDHQQELIVDALTSPTELDRIACVV